MVWMSCTAIGSTPANGSSSIMNFGCVTSARVISRRRRSPPESWNALLLPQVLDVQLVQQRLEPCVPLAGAERQRLEDRQDVVLDGQLAEDGRLLREVADPLPRPLVHRHARDVHAIQQDAARQRLDEAHDHVERGRLPRSIRAQQSDDLPLLQAQGHVVYDGAPAVFLHQSARLENAPLRLLGGRLLRSVRLESRGARRCA